MTPTLRTAVGVVALYGLLLLYLAPSLLAARRDLPGLRLMLRRNAHLGWTGVVWLACLAVALQRRSRPVAAGSPPVTDRVPTWVADLPQARGPWGALPRDTGPFDPRRPS